MVKEYQRLSLSYQEEEQRQRDAFLKALKDTISPFFPRDFTSSTKITFILNSSFFNHLVNSFFQLDDCYSDCLICQLCTGNINMAAAAHSFHNDLYIHLIKYGTFPEIVLGKMGESVKAELLRSYFDSIVQKDCLTSNRSTTASCQW